ncbi:hypothetical protein LOS78_01885 [Paracoccus sp. MA]|uniref:hypothetical protein n=1 Tax=Paracoccus sp. MA TaxID=2895796 RepID=UPI001E5F43E9|nr:hypothetical protein [Paracoccus sp. MA]UFM64250.1 hypothetical protein LOS78_01885 [Paracoccus sp. MA]
MAIGNALQAAVNGFIGGRQVKHGWEDRKIDQARQKRIDELRENAEARAQQSHEMDLETGGLLNTARRQAIRQTDLDWGDSQSLRGVLSQADQAAAAGMEGARAPDLSASLDPATVSTSGGGLLAQQIADAQRAATTPVLDAIRPAAADDRAQAIAEHRSGQPAPATPTVARRPQSSAVDPAEAAGAATRPALGAVRPAASDDRAQAIEEFRTARATPGGPRPLASTGYVDLLRVRPDGMFIANRAPRTDEEKRALLEAAKAGKLATSTDRVAQQREIDANTALDMPYNWGEEGNLVRDLDRAGRLGRRAANDTLARTGEMVANQAIGSVQRINAPLQAASRYATGEDLIGAPQRVDLNRDGSRESMATPLAQSWGAIRSTATRSQPAKAPAPKHAPAAAGDAASESAKATSDSAARVMDEVTKSPAMKAATEAVPAAVLGVSKSRPMTQPQREKAAKTYMESYRENGAPLVIRELMRQGRLADAQNFDKWVKDSRAQEGMTAWGRGIFAALQGDSDGAADAFMDAYNASGYFDDGMDVVKEKSALIKDEAGEVVGVTLTMRDQATGREFTQTDSIDGFIQKAAWITSPEKAFEASQARLQAQQEALLKADEQRQKVANDLITTNYAKTVDLARDMFAKSQAAAKEAREAAMLTGADADVPPPMTWDEAMAEAQRLMTEGPSSAEDPAAAIPPVVARRGQ